MSLVPSFRAVLAAFWLSGQVLVCGSGLAQGAEGNPAAAQALYDEARKLVDAGRYDEACPKFKESYALDPGGGTLLNLADCYEKQGKLALAWSVFKEALVMAERDGRTPRIEFAKQHIASIESRLSYLTVNVSPEAREVSVSVSVDGAPLGQSAWGVALPIDPGAHVVRAEASGKQPFERTIEFSAKTSSRETVEVPALADADDASAGTASTSGSTDVAANTSSGGGQRTLGWVVGGVGVASLAVGGFFGLRAISLWGDRNDACVGGCTREAKNFGDDAKSAATISTIGVAAGVVAVGVGTVLILTAGPSREPSAASARREVLAVSVLASPEQAGLSLRGAW